MDPTYVDADKHRHQTHAIEHAVDEKVDSDQQKSKNTTTITVQPFRVD